MRHWSCAALNGRREETTEISSDVTFVLSLHNFGMSTAMLSALALAALLAAAHAVPAKPHYFTEQVIDHFASTSGLFSQRYYMNDTFFGGPGSPIFVIMGGEGAIEPSSGCAPRLPLNVFSFRCTLSPCQQTLLNESHSHPHQAHALCELSPCRPSGCFVRAGSTTRT